MKASAVLLTTTCMTTTVSTFDVTVSGPMHSLASTAPASAPLAVLGLETCSQGMPIRSIRSLLKLPHLH